MPPSLLQQVLDAKPDPRFSARMARLDPPRPPLVIDGVPQRVMRCGADVVASLGLAPADAQAAAAAIDKWRLEGRIGRPMLPPGIPPASIRLMSLRLAALTAPSAPPPPAIGTPFPRDEPMQKSDSTPPQAVRDACKRGLELAPEYGGPGLTEGAKSRARSMAAGEVVSAETLKRIKAFHARHTYEKISSPPSPGYVAYLLWGGASGRAWANRNAEESDTAEKSRRMREYHTGKFGPRKTEKGKTPKWKKQGYVGPGGAWATAKRKAKEAGKPEAYARVLYAKFTGKK